jgi:hypothetical protein
MKMRMARRGGLGGLVLALGVATTAPAEPAAGDIAARPIRYADLGKFVRGQRGKVVVVDFWADW